MLKILLSSIFRHLISGGGLTLALNGALTQDQVQAFAGAATVIGNVAYSVYKNLKAAKAAKPGDNLNR